MEEVEESVKLFVGQIPKTYGEEDLKTLFSQFGEIQEALVLRDKATQMSKSCGFVTYVRKQDGDRAMTAMHASQVLPGCTNPIQVKYAESELEKQEAKLFVGILPRTTTEDTLRQLFTAYGQIDELTIIRNAHTGESKGFGFVKFSRRASAQNAINCLNGIFQLEGSHQKLIVRFADTPREKERKKQQQMMQHQQQVMMNPGMMQQMPMHSPYNPMAYSQQIPQQMQPIPQMQPMQPMQPMNPMAQQLPAQYQPQPQYPPQVQAVPPQSYYPLSNHPLLQPKPDPQLPVVGPSAGPFSIPAPDGQRQGIDFNFIFYFVFDTFPQVHLGQIFSFITFPSGSATEI